jgi:two-component system, LytTR family, response regulator
MNPLKLLIADDEKEARELLIHYLHEGGYNALMEEVSDGKSALEKISSFHPDIVFLDIKMPEMDGISVMEKKPGNPLPVVIFTTAYDEYALTAFDFEAIDYLLKPFEKLRFEKAMKRALSYIDFIKKVPASGYIKTIAVKKGNRTELIPVETISYFQAENDYVRVVTEKHNYLVPDPVYELETILDPGDFARVHRSVIVNIKFVRQIVSLLNGDHRLILHNGRELRASRTYRENIRRIKNS